MSAERPLHPAHGLVVTKGLTLYSAYISGVDTVAVTEHVVEKAGQIEVTLVHDVPTMGRFHDKARTVDIEAGASKYQATREAALAKLVETIAREVEFKERTLRERKVQLVAARHALVTLVGKGAA